MDLTTSNAAADVRDSIQDSVQTDPHSDPGSSESGGRRGGAPKANINALRTLEYAKDIETRLDGRSLLAQGIKYHFAELLSLFGARTLEELDDTLAREAVRRQMKRRVVRELAWGRSQKAYEEDDAEAFYVEVARFQDACDREEKSERILEERLRKYRERKESGPTLDEIKAQYARGDFGGDQPEETEQP